MKLADWFRGLMKRMRRDYVLTDADWLRLIDSVAARHRSARRSITETAPALWLLKWYGEGSIPYQFRDRARRALREIGSI